ncbi:hypothetical protein CAUPRSCDRAFT_9300 [Caulochytrium protostelioides]|nr:hypothetical protein CAUPRSCDRAFT_9300 [Caulochytrium protostelioides]
MRILSNLCWRNPDAQNRVRTEDGIPVVLNHCVIDDTNPYLKEVALFCIRNLCESNPANQAAIEQLKAEEVLPESTMTKLGLGEMNTAVF